MTLCHILLMVEGFGKYKLIYIIIIVLSCHQHRYPWPSLATPPYCSSLLDGPQGYIPYQHRAVVCRFKPVTLLLLGHVKGSIGEHHSSSSLLLQQCPACLGRLTWIVFVILFTNPSARAGYDTRSIFFFKRSLTGLNSEFFLLLD